MMQTQYSRQLELNRLHIALQWPSGRGAYWVYDFRTVRSVRCFHLTRCDRTPRVCSVSLVYTENLSVAVLTLAVFGFVILARFLYWTSIEFTVYDWVCVWVLMWASMEVCVWVILCWATLDAFAYFQPRCEWNSFSLDVGCWNIWGCLSAPCALRL